MSFDIDDGDREYFYRQHGRPKPQTRLGRIRRSRAFSWSVVAAGLVFIYLLFAGRKRETKVDWTRFAYTLYATDTQSLCNTVLIFDALQRHGSKAERVLQLPLQWHTIVQNEQGRDSQLLLKLQKHYKVTLLPVKLPGVASEPTLGTVNQEARWDTSITKLHAFQLTAFNRVLHLDVDMTLFQHLDKLFLLPPAPVAMPRAYWAPASQEETQAFPLTSMLILLKPDQKKYKAMMETMRMWIQAPDFEDNKKYDMDLLNHQFGTSAMVLPQHPYALLTSEFRSSDHSRYLGHDIDSIEWDATHILEQAKLVHFSDWPMPKPWFLSPPEAIAEMQPKCLEQGGRDCPDRKIWKHLYDDFRRRRKDLCGILSVPAPDWSRWKQEHGADNMTFI